jgi:hypothetical protein
VARSSYFRRQQHQSSERNQAIKYLSEKYQARFYDEKEPESQIRF